MNKAQRNVLSGTLFMFGTLAAVLFVFALARAPVDRYSSFGSNVVLLGMLIGVPSLVLFAAGFYVRAGGKQ